MSKTNSKKKLTAALDELLEHVQQVGYFIGSDEIEGMTDAYRDQYADFERALDVLITGVKNL